MHHYLSHLPALRLHPLTPVVCFVHLPEHLLIASQGWRVTACKGCWRMCFCTRDGAQRRAREATAMIRQTQAHAGQAGAQQP